MLKTLLVTTAVAALAMSPGTFAQERMQGGAGGEPGVNSPTRGKEAPAAKAPEKMGAPSRNEKAMSGDEKASKPATRADEQKMDSQKMDSTEKGRKAEDKEMRSQPGAASRSDSENTKMEEKRGSQQSQGREERGSEQRGAEQSQGREERGSQESQAPQQHGQRATSTEGGERGAGQISTEQRSRLRTGFKGVQVREASGVNITSVRVGANIPRAVSEYWEPVPVAILDIVPAWRDYRVVRIHDEIVVIDPETFEIVYVF